MSYICPCTFLTYKNSTCLCDSEMYVFHLVLIWMTNIFLTIFTTLQKTDFFSSRLHSTVSMVSRYKSQYQHMTSLYWSPDISFIIINKIFYQLREFVSISVTVTSLNLVICNWFLVTWMLDFLLIRRQEVTSWLPLWFGHCCCRCFNTVIVILLFIVREINSDMPTYI